MLRIMLNSKSMKQHPYIIILLLIGFAFISGCGDDAEKPPVDYLALAAKKIYTPPGEHDQFYGFFSGGNAGQIYVYGFPSGRMLSTIPVFSRNPATGYGYSPETKALLRTVYGFIPWDDASGTALSQTDGLYDGRWLFVSAANTPRIARINLATFETVEICELPNSAGTTASPIITENSEYIIAASRFAVPVPQKDTSIATNQNFKCMATFVKLAADGKMSIAFQVKLPGFNFAAGDAGRGASHGWAFLSCYNSEQAFDDLNANSALYDSDYIAAINWKAAEKAFDDVKHKIIKSHYYINRYDEPKQTAKSELNDFVYTLDPAEIPGLVYLLPAPKSPMGVDVSPDGEYIISNGRLAPAAVVFSFSKMLAAINDEKNDGEIAGITILNYKAVLENEVENVGIGPVNSAFDSDGNVYTAAFETSEIVKWRLSSGEVSGRINVHYSPQNILLPGSGTAKPFGDFIISLNAESHDRFIPTGTDFAQSAQMIDISGNKMKILLDFPVAGAPQSAEFIEAAVIKSNINKIISIKNNHHLYATKSANKAKVRRQNNIVHVYMAAAVSKFTPDTIGNIKVGDEVRFHVTNLQQKSGKSIGFAILGANNVNLRILPAQTRTLVWLPKSPGIYPFYNTEFTSLKYLEMSGYVRVSGKSMIISEPVDSSKIVAADSLNNNVKDSFNQDESGKQ